MSPEDAGVRVILSSIASLKVQDVGRQVLEYLNADTRRRLLHEMGQVMLWDGTSTPGLATLEPSLKNGNAVADPICRSQHPARYSSSWASPGTLQTSAQIKSGSATNTGVRFAEGKTTVDVFEE
jgi:hypothetical protein